MNPIPYGKQDISDEDIAAVVAALKSSFLTQGPLVSAFEEDIKTRTGAEYCVATNSATSALHLACLAMGLSAGDELWTSPISFVASSNCALYCGARVDFVDIDARSYNLCPDRLEDKLKRGVIPKVVVPVHLTGASCDMEALRFLAQRYGFRLLEDASHAIGADYQQGKVGSCDFSDATVFSFHPVKIVTTGEGGCITTNDRHAYERMLSLRSHGITRDRACMSTDHGPWYYEQTNLGFNYRITDIQCALGLSQLQRLDDFVQKRRALAARYNEALQSLPLIRPYQADYQQSAWHLYVIRVANRAAVYRDLQEQGIGVNVHYIPIHLQPFYREMGFRPGDFPVAEQYYAEALSLPMFPTLSDDAFRHVVHQVEQALDKHEALA